MTTPTPCDHDKRFAGVFFLPKGTNGCLACAFEQSQRDLAAAQEARQRAEALAEENAKLLKKLRRIVPCLIEVVRMPNVEHVADEHNEAVKELRAIIDAARAK